MTSFLVQPGVSSTLPIARYRLTVRMREPLELPHYAGSLLRGQFGAALRRVACMTRQPTCSGCPLQTTCPYARIFEAPAPPKGSHTLQNFSQIPNSYVIEPPPPGARFLQAGESFAFHTVLIGHARDQLALIIFAWQRALAQGLTKSRSPADLLAVEWIAPDDTAHAIWHRDTPVLLDHPATLELPHAPPSLGESLTLDIHTPLRLQHQGHPLRVKQLTPRALIAALARRTALVMEFHADQPDWGQAVPELVQLADGLGHEHALHWHDWTRYSSRQQQEMTLGGVLGRWTLHGDSKMLADLWPWLWLGQWLHVGKNATMGMGAYRLYPFLHAPT